MENHLQNLRVYVLSEELANFIYHIVTGWNYFARDIMGKQMERAVDSIPVNLAESHGIYHYRDKLQFGYYARGSFEGTKCWVRIVVSRNLLTENQLQRIMYYLDRIGLQLNAFINTYKYPRNKNKRS